LKKLASFRILRLVSVIAVAVLVTGSLCEKSDPSWLEFTITGNRPAVSTSGAFIVHSRAGWTLMIPGRQTRSTR